MTLDENLNKPLTFVSPIFVFILCFVAVIFSINKIIDMAKPNLNTAISQPTTEQYYSAPVNSLIKSSSPLDYKKFKATLSAVSVDHSTLQAQFSVDPEVDKLPVDEQNSIIRLKLLEWKIDQLQNQIIKISSAQSESLIFKIWFWLYSFIIWVGSIVGSQILRFHTDKLIQKKWGDK